MLRYHHHTYLSTHHHLTTTCPGMLSFLLHCFYSTVTLSNPCVAIISRFYVSDLWFRMNNYVQPCKLYSGTICQYPYLLDYLTRFPAIRALLPLGKSALSQLLMEAIQSVLRHQLALLPSSFTYHFWPAHNGGDSCSAQRQNALCSYTS